MSRLRSKFLFCALLLAALPAAAEERPLSADAYVRLVLENNPRLRASRSSVEAARHAADAAGRWIDPMVLYAVAPLSLAGGETVLVHQAEIAQTLPWFGKRALEREMAEASAGREAAEARAVAQELATQARMLFAEQARVKAEAQALQEHLDRLGELRQTTLAAVGEGRATQADVLTVESEFHKVREEQLANQAAWRKLTASLAALAGGVLPAPLSAEIPSFKASVTEGTEETPEVAAAASARKQAEAAARLREKAVYPDVTVFAGVNTMWMEREDWVMAGVRFDLPWTRGKRRAEIDASRAEAQASGLRLAAAEQARERMQAEARARLEEAQARRDLYTRTAIPLARRRLAAARSAYASGQATIDAVVAALRYEIDTRKMNRMMEVLEFEAAAQLAYAHGTALVAGGVQ